MRDFDQAATDLEEIKPFLTDIDACQLGLWTNGLGFFFLQKKASRFQVETQPIGDWPPADETIGSRDVASHAHTRKADPDMLRTAFRRLSVDGRRAARAVRLGLWRRPAGRHMRAYSTICPKRRQPLIMWTDEGGTGRPSPSAHWGPHECCAAGAAASDSRKPDKNAFSPIPRGGRWLKGCEGAPLCARRSIKTVQTSRSNLP